MRGAVHKELQYVHKLLKVQMDGKKGIRTKNKDRVSCIGGPEGVGKSTLLLHIFTYWNNSLLQKPVEKSMIEYIADNMDRFVVALKAAQKFDLVAHDEAVQDLYSRTAMSATNIKLNKAYQIIRGKNLHTVLVLPSILDLDSNFRKRRVTTYYYVYSEGRVAVYLRKTLDIILPLLQKMSEKNENPDPLKVSDENGNIIAPDFLDTFPMYKGLLLEPYLERKETNMDLVIQGLGESALKVNEPEEKMEDIIYDVVIKDLETGLNQKIIAKKYGVNSNIISKINKSYIKKKLESGNI
jgi:hypothetical protein